MDYKDYTKWISKDETEFIIKDMTITYIRHCMYKIIRSINKDFKNENKDVFDELWIKEHGKQYLDAFYNELISRNL